MKPKKIISIMLVALMLLSFAACSNKTEAASIAGDVISVKSGMLSFDGIALDMSIDEAKEILKEKGRDLVEEEGSIFYLPEQDDTIAGLPVQSVAFGGIDGDMDKVHIIIVNFVMPEVTLDVLKDKEMFTEDVKMYFSHGRALYQGWGDYLVTKIGETPYLDGTMDVPGIEINTMAFKDGAVVPISARSDVGGSDIDCSLEATFSVDETFTSSAYFAEPIEGLPLHTAQMQLIMWTTEAYNAVK